MDFFEAQNYKDILKQRILEHRQVRGYKKRLSDAAGCHPSFLSQVLTGEVHLTMDHAWGLCVFWKLDELETDFFLALIQRDRAATSGLRRKCEKDLSGIRYKAEKLIQRVDKKNLVRLKEGEMIYYSSWLHSAVHMLLTTKRWHSAKELSEVLALPLSLIEQSLQFLQSIGLVVRKKDKLETIKNNLHLDRDSPLVSSYHEQWRLKALEALRRSNIDELHYTSVQTIAPRDLKRIRDQFLAAVEKTQKIVSETKEEEELICTTLDIFLPIRPLA